MGPCGRQSNREVTYLDIQKAKALFLRFQGNHFHMQREGQLDAYKAFKISAAQERAWAQESQRDVIRAIDAEDDELEVESMVTNIASMLTIYKNADRWNELLHVLRLKLAVLDSFTVIRSCEEVLRVIEEFQRTNEGRDVCVTGQQFVIDALRGVLDSPIRVSPKYYSIEYLKDTLTQEQLLARASRDLARCDGHRR